VFFLTASSCAAIGYDLRGRGRGRGRGRRMAAKMGSRAGRIASLEPKTRDSELTMKLIARCLSATLAIACLLAVPVSGDSVACGTSTVPEDMPGAGILLGPFPDQATADSQATIDAALAAGAQAVTEDYTCPGCPPGQQGCDPSIGTVGGRHGYIHVLSRRERRLVGGHQVQRRKGILLVQHLHAYPGVVEPRRCRISRCRRESGAAFSARVCSLLGARQAGLPPGACSAQLHDRLHDEVSAIQP